MIVDGVVDDGHHLLLCRGNGIANRRRQAFGVREIALVEQQRPGSGARRADEGRMRRERALFLRCCADYQAARQQASPAHFGNRR